MTCLHIPKQYGESKKWTFNIPFKIRIGFDPKRAADWMLKYQEIHVFHFFKIHFLSCFQDFEHFWSRFFEKMKMLMKTTVFMYFPLLISVSIFWKNDILLWYINIGPIISQRFQVFSTIFRGVFEKIRNV